jgi:exosortase
MPLRRSEVHSADERWRLWATALAFLVAFWPTWTSLIPTWMRSYQEHSFIAFGTTVFVIWSHRELFNSRPSRPPRPYLIALGALSIAWLCSTVMNIGVAEQGLLLSIVTTWALATFDRAKRPILAAAVTFTLAIPLWSFAIPVLQLATTLMSGSIARAVGVPAVIQGDTISLAYGTLIVSGGCSGINFLMAGLTLGALYAHVSAYRWQTQLKVVAVAALAAIVGNWLRVAFLVILGQVSRMQSPWIEDHLWQGWLIFTVLLLPTARLADIIVRRDAHHHAVTRTEKDESRVNERRRPLVPSLMGVAAAVAGPIVLLLFSAIPANERTERTPRAPGISPQWTNLATQVDGGRIWRPAFSGFDRASEWTVSLADGVVHAGRYVFTDQRQGRELIQSGNMIVADSLLVGERLIRPLANRATLVTEAIVMQDREPRLVWYWYRVAGIETPSRARAKLLEVPAFLLRSKESELLALSAPCELTTCERAATLLSTAVAGAPAAPSP